MEERRVNVSLYRRMPIYASPAQGYLDIVQTILKGTRVPSRAGVTYEIEDFSCTFLPNDQPFPPKRPGFSPLLGLMEGVQLVGGFSRPTLMDKTWPKYAEYTDHYGDYGDRVAYGSQVEYVVNTLKTDPNSRRAILVLWNGSMDTDPGHQDYPCTTSIAFRIRDDSLNMTVNMRSNDIWRGASSDFIQFSLLHRTLAELIGVKLGIYTHNVQSMHLYVTDQPIVEAWIKDTDGVMEWHQTEMTPLALPGWTYEQTVEECENALSFSRMLNVKTPMGKKVSEMLLTRHGKLGAES